MMETSKAEKAIGSARVMVVVLNRVVWKDLFWVGRISPETQRRRGSQVCACLEEEYLWRREQ